MIFAPAFLTTTTMLDDRSMLLVSFFSQDSLPSWNLAITTWAQLYAPLFLNLVARHINWKTSFALVVGDDMADCFHLSAGHEAPQPGVNVYPYIFCPQGMISTEYEAWDSICQTQERASSWCFDSQIASETCTVK